MPEPQKDPTHTVTLRSRATSQHALGRSRSANRALRRPRTRSTGRGPCRQGSAADKVAVFADARALAAAGPTNVSPMMAAPLSSMRLRTGRTRTADPLTAVANVVSSVINWVLNPLAGTSPTTPAQPPLIWGLLAFARQGVRRTSSTRWLALRESVSRRPPASHSTHVAARRGGCRDCRPAVPTRFPGSRSAGEPVDAASSDGSRAITSATDTCQHVRHSLAPTSGPCGTTAFPTTRPRHYQRAPGAYRGRRHVQRPQHQREWRPNTIFRAPIPTFPTD